MNIQLRSWEKTDVKRLAIIANNKKIADNLTNHFPYPYNEDAASKYIDMVSGTEPRNIQAIIVDGQVAGSIGIHPQSDIFIKNAELGYWLAEPYWSKGIMTEAIKLMTHYVFESWDINRIFARPFHTNIGSQKALEKSGFKFEARLEKTIYKNEVYLDEMIYSLRK